MISTIKTKNSNLDSTLNTCHKESKTIYSFYKRINTDTIPDDKHECRDDVDQHSECEENMSENMSENIIINSNINILPVKPHINMLLPIQCQNNTGTNNSDFLKNSTPWVEKYRPSCFEDIVLDPLNKTLLKNIIDNKYFPNLLFYGPPGTGKTTTIINIVNLYQEKMNLKNKGLMIHLNASDERGIDIIRNQINSFVNSKSLFGDGMKFVILDEVDYMTKTAQIALRYLLNNYNNNFNVRFCLVQISLFSFNFPALCLSKLT